MPWAGGRCRRRAIPVGSGEAVGAQVAPSDSPLVVLFGEDGADEADDRGKKAAKASSVESGDCRRNYHRFGFGLAGECLHLQLSLPPEGRRSRWRSVPVAEATLS